jgi:hypothetical protein
MFGRELRTVLFRIVIHGSEFVDLKVSSEFSHPVLLIKDGTRRRKLHPE